jgi:flavin reductase (DIM6/NTAB) family NADH-FMN oxidoreductase RutF
LAGLFNFSRHRAAYVSISTPAAAAFARKRLCASGEMEMLSIIAIHPIIRARQWHSFCLLGRFHHAYHQPMQIDPSLHPTRDNYKLLTNLVVPRPIAWVTSLSETGSVNLAPFSFFNAIGSEPLYLMFSVGNAEGGGLKDTARNVKASGEFVVNLITEDLIDAMNISAADFPAGESELLAAGLHPAESTRIKTPRVAEAKASMECVLHSRQEIGNYTLHIGQVVMFHVADEFVGDNLHINGVAPIGRLGSPSMYCRTTDRFDLPRITYGQWKDGAKPKKTEKKM